MRRIVIFGNSGSGKSTLAKSYVSKYGLAHLDLDTLAWENSRPPRRKPLEDSADKISKFVAANREWDDEFSLTSHQRLFDEFSGKKAEILSNDLWASRSHS